MPSNFKKLVRARMAATGDGWQAASAWVRANAMYEKCNRCGLRNAECMIVDSTKGTVIKLCVPCFGDHERNRDGSARVRRS